jgi:hypothetical protein
MLRCAKRARRGEKKLAAAWELGEKYGFTQTLLDLAMKER